MTIERIIAVLAEESTAAREGQRAARTAEEAECYERQTRVLAYAGTTAHLCLAHRQAIDVLEQRIVSLETQQRPATGWGVGSWVWRWLTLGRR